VLQEGLRGVYTYEANEIRSQFGRYVLFNTNFTVNRANPETGDERAMADLHQKYKPQTKLIGEFLSVITTLSDRLSDRTIIIRPHPNENLNLYRKLFRTFDNVVINRKGDVRPWIIGADAVVHNSCTTGIAAGMLGTPVFAYTPDGADVHESPIPNIVSVRIEGKKELIDRIERVEPDETYRMDDDQTDALRRHIGNVDFQSVDRIVSALEPAIDDGQSAGGFQSQFSPGSLVRLHRAFLRTLGTNPLKEPYKRVTGKDGTNYKFDGLDRSELADLVRQVPSEERPDRIKITPAKQVEYTFWVETV
jgi:hypothetical protein